MKIACHTPRAALPPSALCREHGRRPLWRGIQRPKVPARNATIVPRVTNIASEISDETCDRYWLLVDLGTAVAPVIGLVYAESPSR